MGRTAAVQPDAAEPLGEGSLAVLALAWRRRIRPAVLVLAIVALAIAPLALADQAFLAFALGALLYRLDSRYSFGFSLVLLIAIPANQALHVADAQVNVIAVYVFYFLCLGVVLAIFEVRRPKPIVMRPRQIVMPKDELRPLSSLSMMAPVPARPRDPMLRAPRRPASPPPPAPQPVLEYYSQSGLLSWLQDHGRSLYRLLVFPLLVIALSTLAVIYLSPLAQPLLDNLYTKPAATAFINNLKTLDQAKTAQAAMPSASPTPSAPAFDRTTAKVMVENGNGVPGSAAKTAATLKQLGYVIPASAITNATTTHRTTEIYAASGTIASLVAHDIGLKGYVALPLQSTQSPYDVVIITGLAP